MGGGASTEEGGKLSLRGRGIKTLPIQPQTSYKDLRILDLSNNQLGAIPEEWFITCCQLEELYLQNNKIELIPYAVTYLDDLHTLDLSNNDIKTMPHQNLRLLKSLKKLNLAGNPFLSDEALEIPDYGTTDGIRLINYLDYRERSIPQWALQARPPRGFTLELFEEHWRDDLNKVKLTKAVLDMCRTWAFKSPIDRVKWSFMENYIFSLPMWKDIPALLKGKAEVALVNDKGAALDDATIARLQVKKKEEEKKAGRDCEKVGHGFFDFCAATTQNDNTLLFDGDKRRVLVRGVDNRIRFNLPDNKLLKKEKPWLGIVKTFGSKKLYRSNYWYVGLVERAENGFEWQHEYLPKELGEYEMALFIGKTYNAVARCRFTLTDQGGNFGQLQKTAARAMENFEVGCANEVLEMMLVKEGIRLCSEMKDVKGTLEEAGKNYQEVLPGVRADCWLPEPWLKCATSFPETERNEFDSKCLPHLLRCLANASFTDFQKTLVGCMPAGTKCKLPDKETDIFFDFLEASESKEGEETKGDSEGKGDSVPEILQMTYTSYMVTFTYPTGAHISDHNDAPWIGFMKPDPNGIYTGIGAFSYPMKMSQNDSWYRAKESRSLGFMWQKKYLPYEPGEYIAAMFPAGGKQALACIPFVLKKRSPYVLCERNFSVKKTKRMIAKVENAQKNKIGSWPFADNIGDALRSSVVCPDAKSILDAYERVQKAFKVIRVKNKFGKCLDKLLAAGYYPGVRTLDFRGDVNVVDSEVKSGVTAPLVFLEGKTNRVAFSLPSGFVQSNDSEGPWMGVYKKGESELYKKTISSLEKSFTCWYRCTKKRSCNGFNWERKWVPTEGDYEMWLFPKGKSYGDSAGVCIPFRVIGADDPQYDEDSRKKVFFDFAGVNQPSTSTPPIVFVHGMENKVRFTIPDEGCITEGKDDWIGIYDINTGNYLGGDYWYRANEGRYNHGFLWGKKYLPACGLYDMCLIPRGKKIPIGKKIRIKVMPKPDKISNFIFPNIHINVLFDGGKNCAPLLAEIQIHHNTVLNINKEQHKLYEIVRAADIEAVAGNKK